MAGKDAKASMVSAAAMAEGPPQHPKLSGTKNMLVFAKNPTQMESAQQEMVAWAESQVNTERLEVETLTAAREVAKKNKWATRSYSAAITRAQKRLTMYEKVLAALQQGFYLVPNFPVGVFAVRNKKKKPAPGPAQRREQNVANVATQLLPLGVGEYVDAEPSVKQVVRKNKEGVPETRWVADEFQPVSFPFTFVTPDITETAAEAMKLGIFDEIGCLPERRQRRGDPIIVGRIGNKEGYNEKTFTFLLAWFMDLRRM